LVQTASTESKTIPPTFPRVRRPANVTHACDRTLFPPGHAAC